MSSSSAPRLVRFALALALAGLTAGCFQPMYGSVAQSSGGASDKLGAVEVLPIDGGSGTRIGRIAVEVRNDLIFELTGGGPAPASAYKLKIALTTSTRQVIVDINSARPEIQNYGLNATYWLSDGATGKQILSGQTFARVSYNIPGQQQRFAGDRGLRDAENRAAQEIAGSIRARLTSYFVSGT